MKAWKSGCLGAIYIHEISKNEFICKILDLIMTGESEIARKRFFLSKLCLEEKKP